MAGKLDELPEQAKPYLTAMYANPVKQKAALDQTS
jgi:hypothetical protein